MDNYLIFELVRNPSCMSKSKDLDYVLPLLQNTKKMALLDNKSINLFAKYIDQADFIQPEIRSSANQAWLATVNYQTAFVWTLFCMRKHISKLDLTTTKCPHFLMVDSQYLLGLELICPFWVVTRFFLLLHLTLINCSSLSRKGKHLKGNIGVKLYFTGLKSSHK